MKDINKEGDKLWATVGSPERNCVGIKEDNSDGSTAAFIVETSDEKKLGLCDSKTHGVTDSYKIWEENNSKGVI